MPEVSTIILAADTRQIKTAKDDLDRLSESGRKLSDVQATTARQTAQMGQSARLAAEAARPLATVTQQVEKYTLAEAVAVEKLIEKLRMQAATVGMTKTQIDVYKASLLGGGAEAARYAEQIEAAAGSHQKLSLTSARTTREIGVLAHELATGNFSRFGGSMMVLANATGVTGMMFSLAALPIIAVVAALVAFAAAAVIGNMESTALHKALQLTGNYAGVSEQAFNDLAVKLGGEFHAGAGKARDVLMALAASGRFSRDELDLVGKAALAMAHNTGDSAEDVVKDFAKMKDGVFAWASEHDRQYHFLTASQLEHIRRMEKEGDEAGALKLAMTALYDHLGGNAVEQLGALERGWNAVTKAIKESWAATKSYFAFQTPAMQSATLSKDIVTARNLVASQGDPNSQSGKLRQQRLDDLLQEQSLIQEQIRMEGRSAELQGKENVRQTRQKDGDEAWLKVREANMTREQRLAQKIKEANLAADQANVSPKERNDMLQQIRDADAGSPKKPRPTAALQARQDMAEFQHSMDQAKQQASEQNRWNEFNHKYNLTNDQAYYDEKRAIEKAYDLAVRADMGRQVDVLAARTPRDAAERIAIATQIAGLEAKIKLEEQEAASKDRLFAAEEKQQIPQREFNKLLRESADLKRRESEAEDLVKVKVATYQMTAIDSQEVVNRLVRDYAGDLDELVKRMKLLSDANPQNDAMAEAVRKAQAEIDKSREKNTQAVKDPTFAMRESFQKYTKSIEQNGEALGHVMDTAFKGAEDAFVQFTMTGKLSFKSMASSIIADIARIQARKAIAGMVDMAVKLFTGTGETDLGPLQAAGSTPTGLASGGPAAAGSVHEVNEEGPEMLSSGGKDYLMMGSRSGMVTPNGKLGGDVSVTVVVNAQTGEKQSSGTGDGGEMRRFGNMIGDKVREVIVTEKRNGGLLA